MRDEEGNLEEDTVETVEEQKPEFNFEFNSELIMPIFGSVGIILIIAIATNIPFGFVVGICGMSIVMLQTNYKKRHPKAKPDTSAEDKRKAYDEKHGEIGVELKKKYYKDIKIIEEKLRQELILKMEEEEMFRSKGLRKFTSRDGEVKWGTPEQIEEWNNEIQEQTMFNRVVNAIEEFVPSQKWEREDGYHAELQGWLRKEFPQSRVEIQRGSSRPDILIDEIAIEVKGPTRNKDLESCANKCMRYPGHFKTGLIIVLFDVFVKRRYYEEWRAAMAKQYPDVVVIRISSRNDPEQGPR